MAGIRSVNTREGEMEKEPVAQSARQEARGRR